MFHVPEQYRIAEPRPLDKSRKNGAFLVPYYHGKKPVELRVIASDGAGWDHVSVSLPSRTPTWEEMAYIKQLFWDEDDWVVQYHPAREQYVNCHRYCLHLWKAQDQTMPVPEIWMVGPKL